MALRVLAASCALFALYATAVGVQQSPWTGYPWDQGPTDPPYDPNDPEPTEEEDCSGVGFMHGGGPTLDCTNNGCEYNGQIVSCDQILVQSSLTDDTGAPIWGHACRCFTNGACCALVVIEKFGFSTTGDCDKETCVNWDGGICMIIYGEQCGFKVECR